ncbi:transmembrane protein 17B [Caerostris darwini]|uniref:Transmembrane protein 17B n=1 Tax=Caerostris darwini TaxID=1538125 RepID=A0AAV4TL63_9ARAC|nr:transmembrane protein 17B [Caerostris darwini]
MDVMRSAAHKVTEVVFPGIKISYGHKFSRKSEEVLSSLPLQMCLYFNVNYSPLWILVRIGCLIYKFYDLSQLYQILLTTIIVLMIVVEISRLYLGYVGNLTEKVPELAVYLLLIIVWLTSDHFNSCKLREFKKLFPSFLRLLPRIFFSPESAPTFERGGFAITGPGLITDSPLDTTSDLTKTAQNVTMHIDSASPIDVTDDFLHGHSGYTIGP